MGEVVQYPDRLSFDEMLDRFMERYPLPVGTLEAKRQLGKALHEATFGEIMGALEDYRNSETVKSGFVVHPAKWLKEGRFLDARYRARARERERQETERRAEVARMEQAKAVQEQRERERREREEREAFQREHGEAWQAWLEIPIMQRPPFAEFEKNFRTD